MRKITASIILFTFLTTSCVPPLQAQALMPAPGQMVALSPAFRPALFKGIKVYRDDPFRFDFILDKGDAADDAASRLIKYFLAALTIPEKDLWVNLSPYEKDRIVPDGFGQTEMGRDLLAQDYILKQITASLLYPDGETGRKFWTEIYRQAAEKYGTTDIPVDTFNKVWIVPEKAVVYENAGAAFVVDSRLKVMLEADRLAETFTDPGSVKVGVDRTEPGSVKVFREVIIPVLEKEVNEGRNFIQLRQAYHALVLATWYKKRIRDSVISRAYVDREKLTGVDIADKDEKEKIWARYVEAFQKGVFNFVKEEREPVTDEKFPRKYFSGGMGFAGNISGAVTFTTDASVLSKAGVLDNAQMIQVRTDVEGVSAPGQKYTRKKIEDILLASPLNDAGLFLGDDFKKSVEKEFNDGKPLYTIRPVPGEFDSVSPRVRANLLEQWKNWKDDRCVYFPQIRYDPFNRVFSYLFLIARVADVKKMMDAPADAWAEQDAVRRNAVLINEMTMRLEEDGDVELAWESVFLDPLLRGRGRISLLNSRMVEFLSRNFAGMPIKGWFVSEVSLHLFQRDFTDVRFVEGRITDKTGAKWIARVPVDFQVPVDGAQTVDQRPVVSGLLKPAFVGYAMAVKEVVNPRDREIVAVYGGAGADISSFLLSTNAARAYFVDIASVDGKVLHELMDKWDELEDFGLAGSYPESKQEVGFGDSTYDALSTYPMKAVEHKLLLELKLMGVGRQDIRIGRDDEGLVTIEFKWAYTGQSLRTYRVSFIQADMTAPEKYPAVLKEVLGRGIDVYYQRAGLFLPVYYDVFLRYFADALRPGGFLVTDDNKLSRGGFAEINPDGMFPGFTSRGELLSDGMRHYGAQLRDVFKNTGTGASGISYGWEVNIRQKKAGDADKAQTLDVEDYYDQGGRALIEALGMSLDKGKKVFLREDGVDLEVLEQWEAGSGAGVFLCQDASGKRTIIKILDEHLEEMGILEKQSIVMFFDILRVDEKTRSLFAWFEGGESRFASFYRLNMVRMEYVDGRSFSEITDLKERLPLLVRLIEGLARLHREYRTFHGDLHDGNIRVTPDGQLKLIDWDHLRALSTDEEIGRIRFGMKYKDIFSMGRSLLNSYGVSRVSSSGWKDMFGPVDVARRVPTSLEEVGHVPAGMLRIIRKAMLVDPKDHYESLDEMLADLRRELKAEGFADMAQAPVQQVFMASPLNDAGWLGSLKEAVEKEFNQGRPLRSLGPVVQSAWWGVHRNWDALTRQLQEVAPEEYVYVPVIETRLTGEVAYDLFIVRAGAAVEQIAWRQSLSGLALPDNQDLLFVFQTTARGSVRNRSISLNMLTIWPSLQDRHFSSEFFPRYVEFLSRHFPRGKVQAEIRNPRTRVLFERYFKPMTYAFRDMAVDLLSGLAFGYFDQRTTMLIPEDFHASVDHAQEVDPRPVQAGLLMEPFVGYAMAVKEAVNPDDRDLVAVYGGAGADVSNFLLSTNATTGYFVDIADVDKERLHKALEKWDNLGRKAVGDDYLDDKRWYGYARSSAREDVARPMTRIEQNLMVELKAMGVRRESISIGQDDNGFMTLGFTWAYPGAVEKRYIIKFVKADIAFYKDYPQALKDVIERGFDIYYQRAGFFLPRQYDYFLPYFARHLKPGGHLVTDDMAGSEESRAEVDPDGLLAEFMPGQFTARGEIVSDGMEFWGERAAYVKGRNRASEENKAYGWRVNIRQKKPVSWKDFIMGGIKKDPSWVKSPGYQSFQPFELEEGLPMEYILNRFMVSQLFGGGDPETARQKVELASMFLEKRGIIVPFGGRGLALGIGFVTQELLTLKEVFGLSVIHGVEWNADFIRGVAGELAAAHKPPKEFVLHHADMNDLRPEVPDGSVDLIYASQIAVDINNDGTDLKASLALDVVRMLAPGGVAVIVAEGVNLMPVFKEEEAQGRGKVVRIAGYIIFQKKVVADAAQAADKGGIDLDPAQMHLDVKGPGAGVLFDLDPSQLERMTSSSGLMPVIINVQPLKSLSQFLGLSGTDRIDEDSINT